MPMNLELEQLSIVKHGLHVCLEPPGSEREHAHGEGHHAQLPHSHHHGDNGWGLRTDNGTVETMRCWTLLNRNIDLQGICCEFTLLFKY